MQDANSVVDDILKDPLCNSILVMQVGNARLEVNAIQFPFVD
jgi:hypothetical protein